MYELDDDDMQIFAWQWWRLAWTSNWCGTALHYAHDGHGEWRRVAWRLAVLVRRAG